MINFDWFPIFNLTEFNALGLVSKEYTLNLDGIGEKTILVCKGAYVSIQYEGVFLPINLNSENPFEFESVAVYLAADQQVYLGVEVET